jgi:hypothetical protein
MREQWWAIVGRHGLYAGHWQRRSEAIRSHVSDLVDFPGFAPKTEIKKQWARCRRKGDRVVKVTITWRSP